MCLTIPGKIVEINKRLAVVENGSRTAQIDLGLLFDVKVGDWVLYATDRAVRQISANDAGEIIKLLEDHYRPVDVSRLSLEFKKIIIKVRSKNQEARIKQSNLTQSEVEYLLKLNGRDTLETFFAEANSIRKTELEDFVCIHGIIEFSNHCRNNCLYCGIRYDNRSLKRYRMGIDEIYSTARIAVEEGYKLIVLQSGEDVAYSDDDLLKIIERIQKSLKVFVFLSVGERSKRFYKNAFEAGASGSLFRFETSNPELYAKMHPGHTLEERLDCLRHQIDFGYYIASGSLVGLPGQTNQDITRDLLLIKELGIPMISSGPWLSASGTPIDKKRTANNENRTQIELFLKYIAAARFLMPKIKIPVTTALETLDPENGRHRGLLAGANALMFNLTPEKYAGSYNIYDNKYREREKVWQKYGLFTGEESYEMLEERLKKKML